MSATEEMSKLSCIPNLKEPPMSESEIKSCIRDIRANCFAPKSTNFQARQKKALNDLRRLSSPSNREKLRLLWPREIIHCSIKIMSYFAAKHREKPKKCNVKRESEYEIATKSYERILQCFVPEKIREIVYSLVEIMQREKFWQWEDLRLEMSRGMLKTGIDGEILINFLLDRIELSTRGFEDSRATVTILYDILKSYPWPRRADTTKTVERLLNVYYSSLTDGKIDGIAPYAPLRQTLEICVRNATKNLSNDEILVIIVRMCSWSIIENTSDSMILNFSGILEFAARRHETQHFRDTLDSRLFPILMRMISSPRRLVNLLGNRVIHDLIDRSANKSHFQSPSIFFHDSNFSLRPNWLYAREDKVFLRKNRELLHDSLVPGILRHSKNRLNLESSYRTICLFAVEIPCGFTAAALVCLVMNLQDLCLEQRDLLRETSAHIHATVIAVLSLLCWIHRARVFFTYVNKIMMLRAQWAPHLNPPIQSRYGYAAHHVLWDKPELFFVDWEARYGLWKCFHLQAASSGDEKKENFPPRRH